MRGSGRNNAPQCRHLRPRRSLIGSPSWGAMMGPTPASRTSGKRGPEAFDDHGKTGTISRSRPSSPSANPALSSRPISRTFGTTMAAYPVVAGDRRSRAPACRCLQIRFVTLGTIPQRDAAFDPFPHLVHVVQEKRRRGERSAFEAARTDTQTAQDRLPASPRRPPWLRHCSTRSNDGER